MTSSTVVVLKHYTCVECGRVHTRPVMMPLEDWQAYRDALIDTGQRYTRITAGELVHHWHLSDVCLACYCQRHSLDAGAEEAMVPPVPQLMPWKQRLLRAVRKLFH